MTDGHSIEEAALRYVDRANQGRLREAIDGFRELIVEAEREDDEANLALLWDCLGDSLARARDFDGAVESYRESIALDRDPVGFAQSYRGLGIVYHLAGDVVRARDSFDEALAALRQTEQPEADHERVVLFCGIGSMYEHHADFTKAIDAYEKARAIAEKGGNERDLALCSRHLGSVHKEQGDLDAAENYLRQAADLLDDIGDSASMERITLHNLLGAVTEDRGDVASAIESYRAAMDLADRIDFPPGRMESLRRLGSAEAARGQFQRASES